MPGNEDISIVDLLEMGVYKLSRWKINIGKTLNNTISFWILRA
jgi:hypothetical protein